jgi:hypothetical protein
MFSAPAVLVEPKGMIADEASPAAQERFEWATMTPEPSPVCLLKVPSYPCDDFLCSFKSVCSPVWEQMLSRIANHAGVLGAAEPSVRPQLIHTLCQPFFEQAVEVLCADISSVGMAGATMACPCKDDRITLNLGRGLGFLEEDSTDADSDSAFAALLSSEGEDCEVEQRMEWASHSSPLGFDVDSESLKNDEKSEMVCRHWTSKGWCRYQSQCKFLHPENECGISAKAPPENGNVFLPKVATRRRGGRNKRNMGSLDSHVFFADSYNVCRQFALSQSVQTRCSLA